MTYSLKHLFGATMIGMVVVSSATIAVAQEPQLRRNVFEDLLPLSVMQAVGDIFGVNVNVDSSYNNFYVIGASCRTP